MNRVDPDCFRCHGTGTYESYYVDTHGVGHDMVFLCYCEPVDESEPETEAALHD